MEGMRICGHLHTLNCRQTSSDPFFFYFYSMNFDFELIFGYFCFFFYCFHLHLNYLPACETEDTCPNLKKMQIRGALKEKKETETFFH